MARKKTQQVGGKKQNTKSEPAVSQAGELSDTELDQVAGGDGPANADVVGGALTAGKVAVPWAIFRK